MGSKEDRTGAARVWVFKVGPFCCQECASDSLISDSSSQLFPQSSVEQFHGAVREHLLKQMDQLVPEAVLGVKGLLRTGLKEKNDCDAVNLRESYAQAERFKTGVPFDRFRKIAMKEIRHKL